MHLHRYYKPLWTATMLAVLTMVSSGFVNAYTDLSNTVSLHEATAGARYYVERFAQTVHPEWKGGKPGQATAYLGYDGTTAAYLFPVVVDGAEKGYVLISATKERMPLLEASTSAPPHSKLQKAESDLASSLSSQQSLGEPELLYLHALAFMARYPVLEGGQVVDYINYHLLGEYIVPEGHPILEFRFQPTATETAKQAWAVISDMRVTSTDIEPTAIYYKDLNVPSYDQRKGSCSICDCGPTSGAAILQYWRNNGYPSIRGLSYYGSQGAFIDHVSGDMGTTITGTSVGAWKMGMIFHANVEAPYSFAAPDQYPTTYGSYTSSIDDDVPVGVKIGYNSHLEWSYHWVAGRGYLWEPGIDRLMHVNDSYGSDDWLSYDEYQSYLHFVFFEP